MQQDTILFDINETVLDLSLLKPKFKAAFNDETVAATWFASLLHNSTVCILTGVKTGFADLAGAMLDNIAARQGIKLSDEQRNTILSTFAALQPHDDIKPSLEKLKNAGYRTVAFSNSSLKLVTSQIENAGLSPFFDEIISVEETGSFKPDPKVYQYGADKLNRPISELRLIATHDWDTHGAMCAGMQAGYIDRSGAPYHPLFKKPEIIGNNMIEVVDQVMAAGC